MFVVFFIFAPQTQSASNIIFTEIMYNLEGTDSEHEWVEIYNNSDSEIDLSNWKFYDGDGETKHGLNIFQGSIVIPKEEYVILVDKPEIFLEDWPEFSGIIIDSVVNLKNDSDNIKLFDSESIEIDSVVYQNDWGADGDGNSLQLSGLNWIAQIPTPGQVTAEENPAEDPEPDPEEPSEETQPIAEPTPTTGGIILPKTAYPENVKITEVFPNPSGSEEAEFIEIWNNNNTSISLENWKLSDKSKVITLKAITLVPGEYKAIYRSTTKIALNNSSETIYLYDSNGNLVDEVSYSSTIEDYSYSYDIKQDDFFWSSTKTPSSMNDFTNPNNLPSAVINFSNNPVAPKEIFTIYADNLYDSDNDNLSCLWEIGKNFQANGESFKYSFNDLGEYIIKLTINDGHNEVITTSVIRVLNSVDVVYIRSKKSESTGPITNTILTLSSLATTTGQIFITEIFPNPEGSDDAEYIKLYNPNNFDVILDNWTIDDQDGGSKPHTIQDRAIKSRDYLILGKEETKLTLNNTFDEVRLFNKDEHLIDSVLYDDVKENQTYKKTDEGIWIWSEEAIQIPKNYEIINYVSEQNYSTINSDIVDIDLPDIRELEIGTEVRVQGTVAVEPGVLGKTYFYITGSQGIQVYFYKKDWPNLSIGDVIGVIGELSESNNETRIKVSNKEDIVPLYESDPPSALEIETGEIGENFEGALIKIFGELIEKKGTSWFIDDGSGEAKITFQPSAEIVKPNAKEGDWINIIGLVSETKTGYRVLPRYQEDINIVDINEMSEEEIGQVLGVNISNQGLQNSNEEIKRFKISENKEPQKIFIYLLITLSAFIVLLISLIIKFKIETKKRIKALKEKIKKN